MQVADLMAQQWPRTAQARTAIAAQLSQSLSITTQQMSPAAVQALGYIARSTRLSGADKHTLTQLVAYIDQYAGGDPKVMKQVLALAKLMEMNHPEGSYRSHTFQEIVDDYWNERKKLAANTTPEVAVSTQILVVEQDVAARIAPPEDAPANK